MRVFALLTTLSLLGASGLAQAPAAGAHGDVDKPAVNPGDGWVVLFDGKSTEAWRGYGAKEFPAAGWVVRDGALVHTAQGGGGDIISRRQFANFELQFEWRVAAKANSGVMYRVIETEQPSYFTGPEYQVIDDQGSGATPDTSTGSLYALAAPKGKTLKPVGEWNSGKIVSIGERVEHWVNGVKVVEVDFASDAYKAALAKSKIRQLAGFRRQPPGPYLPTGSWRRGCLSQRQGA